REERGGIRLHARDAELVCHGLPGLGGAVADRNDLDAVDRLEAGDVLPLRVPTGANDADAQGVRHIAILRVECTRVRRLRAPRDRYVLCCANGRGRASVAAAPSGWTPARPASAASVPR